MNLGQLRKVLRAAEGHYRAEGQEDVADGLRSFSANVLKGNDSETVSAFVGRVKRARKPSISRTSGKRVRERSTQQ